MTSDQTSDETFDKTSDEVIAAADAADRAYQTESPAGQDPPDDDVAAEAADVSSS